MIKNIKLITNPQSIVNISSLAYTLRHSFGSATTQQQTEEREKKVEERTEGEEEEVRQARNQRERERRFVLINLGYYALRLKSPYLY